MQITSINIDQSTGIDEREVERIINENKIFAGYKDINGRPNDLTDYLLRFYTKKNFTNKKEIIGKNEYDLFEKQHWKFVEVFQRNDNIANQQHLWHGIEFAFLDKKLIITEVIKKRVINNEKQDIGSFCQIIQIFDQYFSQSIIDFLHIINPVTETTNSNYEFYPQDNSIDLTNRETECLFYTIRGKTSKAIAHILNISSKTVEFHIENLKTKFQCHSKSQLVYKAIEQGYLDKIPASFINASNVCLIP